MQENNRIKFSGTSYFNVTNVFGTPPLNAEGQELTAYPNIYMNSVFTDGSVGYNNSETSTYYKQTVDRRGLNYELNDGIVTLYLRNPNIFANRTFPTNTEFGNTFTYLWYVVNLGTSGVNTIVNKVKLLSYSVVTREDIPYVGNTEPLYLELTVLGNKEDIQILLKEYDEFDSVKKENYF